MTPKRIFVTGASGCIGHYLAEALIQETEHELYFLVRNPDKVRFNWQARPGVQLLQADMREIERLSDFLKSMDAAVLVATAWGGQQDTFDINILKTLRLLELLDPNRCEQVIYFSTASILNRENQLLKEAGQLGTDYIRSKYTCYQQLSKLAIAPKITTVFPTLVLGGDDQKPYSHISAGIGEVVKYIKLIRYLKADGTFHFIHGRDIAQVIRHLVDHPPEGDQPRQLVLGNAPTTVNQAIEETCAYLNQPISFRIELSPWLTDLLIAAFRIQMAAWDRFSLNYRHFTYQNVVNPSSFGLPTYCETFTDILKISGIPSDRTSIQEIASAE